MFERVASSRACQTRCRARPWKRRTAGRAGNPPDRRNPRSSRSSFCREAWDGARGMASISSPRVEPGVAKRSRISRSFSVVFPTAPSPNEHNLGLEKRLTSSAEFAKVGPDGLYALRHNFRWRRDERDYRVKRRQLAQLCQSADLGRKRRQLIVVEIQKLERGQSADLGRKRSSICCREIQDLEARSKRRSRAEALTQIGCVAEQLTVAFEA